jgi:hypothetical protein
MDWFKTLVTSSGRSSRSPEHFPVATHKTIAGVPAMVTTNPNDLTSQGLIQGETPTATMLHISTR